MSLNNPGLDKAARHAAQAREYRRLADLLLTQENSPAAAGELLYAAAKQCINAVANRRGENPGSTGAKVRFLYAIAEREPEGPALTENWQFADRLHTHSDQNYLTASRFTEAWQAAQDFISQMLEIYAAAEPGGVE